MADYNCPLICMLFLIVSETFTETLETIYKPRWSKWAAAICRLKRYPGSLLIKKLLSH